MYAGSRNNGSTRSLNQLAGAPAEVARYNTQTFHLAKFPHKLSFYERPPLEEITLEEFEEWALDRLRVLADIETASARNRNNKDMAEMVGERLKKHLPLSGDPTKMDEMKAIEKQRKKDQYSHFVLRLAFCRSEELRARFLKAETSLFRIRWEADTTTARKEFVESLNFGWGVVTPEEKIKYRHQLATANPFGGIKEENIEFEPFFKVHWTKVADLVSQRKVFVSGGQAFVPSKEELSLVTAEFSTRLSSALELTAKALPRLDEDERLLPILSHLSMGFMAGIGSEYTVPTGGDGEELTAEMVPGLSTASFPFCMRSLQDALKGSGHLKHEGRHMYNLFLKGIGLSVDEAVIFWRKSFSMTDDKFNKEYKYNIRHGYGLEGSRKSYAPKSCQSIITGKSPGPGEVHGCPFRHFSEANLSSALQSTYHLSPSDLKEVLGSVKKQHYHVACTRVFEIQHAAFGVVRDEGIGNGDSVDHPNRFFDRSRVVRKAAAEEEEKKVKEEGVKMDVD